MDKNMLAGYIDQTNLKPGMSEEFIEDFCRKAAKNEFASVCILPALIPVAARVLKGTKTKVCTVISFPLGADLPAVKINETKDAIEKGAEEIDLVINVAAVKDNNRDVVMEELNGVVQESHKNGCLVKVIIEMPLLTKDEGVRAAKWVEEAGAEIVKTSTGFSALTKRATTVEDVELLKNVVADKTGIKAAGGIRTTEQALAMIEAGATRIGASSGKDIVDGLK